jgi:plastocyanin
MSAEFRVSTSPLRCPLSRRPLIRNLLGRLLPLSPSDPENAIWTFDAMTSKGTFGRFGTWVGTGTMRKLTMLTAGLVVALGLAFVAVGVAPGGERTAQAEGGGAITINQFQYNPAELAAKVGQPITITNNDDMPHTVTAKDGSFDAQVPAKGNATVTVPKAGNFPYECTLHPGQHNPASIKAS